MMCFYCRRETDVALCDGCEAPVCAEHREPGSCVMCRVQPRLSPEEQLALHAEYHNLRVRWLMEVALNPDFCYDGLFKDHAGLYDALTHATRSTMMVKNVDFYAIPDNARLPMTTELASKMVEAGVVTATYDLLAIGVFYPLTAKALGLKA